MTQTAHTVVAGHVGAHASVWQNSGAVDLSHSIREALIKSANAAKDVCAATVGALGSVRAVMGKSSLSGSGSLSSRDLRVHFDVAIALISVIPMLVFSYVFLFNPPPAVRGPAFGVCLVLSVLGYMLIGKYPKTLLRLHDYLRQVAHGEMPRVACLMQEEKDIVATERYLNLILNTMRDKIRTIEEQKQCIADIERKKAIAESLCTTCHYLGQPATVIVAYLDLMEREAASPAMLEMIGQCQIAGASITRILSTLNNTADCQSVPYLLGDNAEAGSPAGERILSIEGLADYEMSKIAI